MTFKVLLHHYGRFTSPPRREFVDELIATIDSVDIDTFSANQVKLILTNYVGYDKNSPTFIYIKKPNCSLDSGLVPFEDAIQERGTILMYTHHNRLHVYVSRVELSPLVVAELFRDETNKRENQGKPSCAKNVGKLQISFLILIDLIDGVDIPNDVSLEESFAAQYKLEIYIDHIGVNFVIHKYIFLNASLAEMMNHVITDYLSENKGIIRQETQNDYTFDQMVEWAEQEHFEYEETKVSHPKIDLSSMLIHNNRSKEESFEEAIDEEAILEEQILALMHRFADRFMDRRVEINNLMVLHDHPLVDYGKYALGCMTGADMKKCVYLRTVKDELLRSMEEKRQLMANYRDMLKHYCLTPVC
ncbi:hypothetical protein Tco_0502473 [Tanacetum coccineum]